MENKTQRTPKSEYVAWRIVPPNKSRVDVERVYTDHDAAVYAAIELDGPYNWMIEGLTQKAYDATKAAPPILTVSAVREALNASNIRPRIAVLDHEKLTDLLNATITLTFRERVALAVAGAKDALLHQTQRNHAYSPESCSGCENARRLMENL